MHPNKRQQYALAIMIDLAIHSQIRAQVLTDIADRLRIIPSYLESMLMQLRRAGLVKSWRGPGGGYSLGRALELISLADIVLAVEPKATRRARDEGQPVATVEHAPCCDLWALIDEKVRSYMAEISLLTLARVPCFSAPSTV